MKKWVIVVLGALIVLVFLIIIFAIPLSLIIQLKILKPHYTILNYIDVDYNVIYDANLSATINITTTVPAHLGEYYAPPYYQFSLPDDFVLLELKDDLGKIEDYTIIESNRTFTDLNYTTKEPIITYTTTKDLKFTINDTTRNFTTIFLSFSTKKTYGNNTPLFYNILNVGSLINSVPEVHENFEITLPEGFYFIAQKKPIKYANYLVSQNKNAAKISYVETNKSKLITGSFGITFFENATKGNWTLLETDKFIVAIENPSEKQKKEFEVADEFFWILENITGFETPYEKFIIEVFDFPKEYCTGRPACAGLSGFITRPEAISADTIIHESMHSYQEEILKGTRFDKYPTIRWFLEGLATYAENLFVKSYKDKYSLSDYYLLKPLYKEIKDFCLEENRTIDNEYFLYVYSAYTFHAYVQQCGEGALRKVFLKLEEVGEDSTKKTISTDEFLNFMGDACGKNMSEEDIDCPYKNLLLENEEAFKEKIRDLVYMDSFEIPSNITILDSAYPI